MTRHAVTPLITPLITQPISPASQSGESYERTDVLTNEDLDLEKSLTSSTSVTRETDRPTDRPADLTRRCLVGFASHQAHVDD